MATAVLSVGEDLCVVMCYEAASAHRHIRLPQEQQLALLLNMMRRHDQQDSVMRLLEHHCREVLWRSLPPQLLRSNLLRLMVLLRLEVYCLPRLTRMGPRAAMKAQGVVLEQLPPEHLTSAKSLSSEGTRLRLWYHEREQPLCVPVQLQAGAVEQVVQSISGHTIGLPRAMDTPSTAWQLQHLLQAARQGSLHTWGAGMGDAQAAAPSSTLGG